MTLGLISAITAGLKDSASPGALTAILLFIVFLYLFINKGQRFVWAGVFFIVGDSFTRLVLIFGMFDFILRM